MSNAKAARRQHNQRQADAAQAHADEIRYCERCGISYLWSIEEQAEAAALREGQGAGPAPELCAGCRTLLPPPGRVRGLVKWYNIRKRYGFLVRQGGPELFVPAAALRGPRFLQAGDLVEFSLGENQEGPIAQDVTLLQRGDAA